eukprot:2672875-Amphidinium_carterae.1
MQDSSTLHEITEHQDSEKNKHPDDGKAREKHESDGHIPKDPACPACVRESGSRVLHYKGHEPHYGTLYMDLGKMNKPDYFGREYYLVAGLRVRLDDNTGEYGTSSCCRCCFSSGQSDPDMVQLAKPVIVPDGFSAIRDRNNDRRPSAHVS